MKEIKVTIKITEETHKQISTFKAAHRYKTIDEAISELLKYFYYTPLSGRIDNDK